MNCLIALLVTNRLKWGRGYSASVDEDTPTENDIHVSGEGGEVTRFHQLPHKEGRDGIRRP